MIDLRPAASFEGLIVLAVIYFILSALQRAGKSRQRQPGPARRPEPEPPESSGTQEEGFSLDQILREIEGLKQQRQQEQQPPAPRPVPRSAPPRRMPAPAQTPQPETRVWGKPKPPVPRGKAAPAERGPLGRKARVRLESHEEVEERDTLEGASLETPETLEILDETRLRTRAEREVFDQDDDAEALVQRRITAAEARNRAHSARDHVEFHDRVDQRARKAAGARPAHLTTRQLRDAFVWREILGPPRAFED